MRQYCIRPCNIKNSLFFIFLSLFLSFVYQENSHATAGAQVYFKNNCTYPVNFLTGNVKLTTIENSASVNPHQIKNGSYFEDTSKGFGVKHDDKIIGSMDLQLQNGWLGNYLETRNITGKINIDKKSMTWHNWYGTPSFTITACPLTIDVPHSQIFSGIHRIIIFGDSLSDKGTLHEYTQGIIPKSLPYYSGMFSNGDVWSVLLKNQLEGKIPVSNYAVGGATAILHTGAHLPYNLQGEYNVYKLNNLPEPPDKQMAFILIGANDYLTVDKNMSAQDADRLTSDVVNSIKWLVDQLRSLGVHDFAIFNLPDLGSTPESHIDLANNKVTTMLTLEHNQKLDKLLNAYKSQGRAGENFHLIDLHSLFMKMVNNTDIFNKENGLEITDTVNSCWKGGYTIKSKKQKTKTTDKYFYQLRAFNTLKKLPKTSDIITAAKLGEAGGSCESPQHYLFWDRVHPTAQLHTAFYHYVTTSLGIKTTPKIFQSQINHT